MEVRPKVRNKSGHGKTPVRTDTTGGLAAIRRTSVSVLSSLRNSTRYRTLHSNEIETLGLEVRALCETFKK
jgi:hypothetical protein